MPAPSAFLLPPQSAGWPTVPKTRKVDVDGFHFIISRHSVIILDELSEPLLLKPGLRFSIFQIQPEGCPARLLFHLLHRLPFGIFRKNCLAQTSFQDTGSCFFPGAPQITELPKRLYEVQGSKTLPSPVSFRQ